MKKFFKAFTKFALALSLVTCMFLSLYGGGKTHADSGYDTSYSGGSSSHSSSYSSSSSSRSSSRSSSSYGSSSSGSGGSFSFGGLVIWIIIIIIIIYFSSKKNTNGNIATPKLQSNLAAIAKIKELLPEFNEQQFLKDGYAIYLDVQDAWSNFNLDKVKEKITDELFNQYESQLSSMEIKGEQNIMTNFVLKDSAISNCVKQNDNIEVTAKYVVEFYDYIINKESGAVLRGSKTHKVRMSYDLTFIMSASQTKIEYCPNCGAKVNVNSAGTCEYCGSKIVGENANWVMSKKICTRQINL